MNLYSHAESNIRKTWLYLAGLFVLIMAVAWVASSVLGNPSILYIAVVLSLAMNIGAYWFSDKVALSMMKAKPLEKVQDPELYRIVENLSITAGLPIPKIYIMETAAMNAFATGRDARHAVVAITRGLREKLDRPELEGVLAHELSHVGNKDILLSTIVVVLVGLVALLSDFFFRMMWFGGMRGNRDDKGGQHTIFLVIGIAALVLAPLVATLMQLAISRRREFLADASGALLTRYPEGLARALHKLALDAKPLPGATHATSHLFIDDPFQGKPRQSWFHKLFLTHPPIEERIAALQGMKI